MGIDTILMCYLTDSEANDGNPVFADESLKSFVDTHGKLKDGQ
jgi:hypothetical protein